MDSIQSSSSKLEFNIALFKSLMEEAPSVENGWNFEYDGIIPNFPDSTMKIYNKFENTKCGFTTRVDAVLYGVKAKNIVLMMRDIGYRKKALHPPKKIKSIAKTGSADIIYVELDLPEPLINRDMVQKRLFVGNKENPELARRLGLFDCEHEYYAVLTEPIQRPEYPAKSIPIRSENMHYTLLEEDPNDKNVVRMRIVMSMDLAGDIPPLYMNVIRQNVPFRMMMGKMACYEKFFGKGGEMR